MSCNSKHIEEFLSREGLAPSSSSSFITWNPYHPETITVSDEEECIIRIISEKYTLQVDVKNKRFLHVSDCSLDGVKHNVILDLSVDGDRWEGDVLDSKPFGWGIAYDKNGNKSYEGFRLAGVNACFGRSYYSDLDRIAYEGTWFEGKRWGRGTQFDRNGDIVYQGEWLDDEPLKTNVTLGPETEVLHSRITELYVCNNTCNEKTWRSLSFRLMPRLRVLEIGDYCFECVGEFPLTGMSELERVTVGIRSFFSVYGSGLNRLFLLKDCPKLKELKIGSWSFPSYSACVIESVPSLETIEIGDMDEESYNFDCATLQLRGKWLLVQ